MFKGTRGIIEVRLWTLCVSGVLGKQIIIIIIIIIMKFYGYIYIFIREVVCVGVSGEQGNT